MDSACCGCTAEKHTPRTAEQKKTLVNRLKRIEGQIRGLEQMVENDAYCTDLLQQSAAAGSAINAFNQELLSDHIRGCVKRGIQEGDDEIVEELVKSIRKLMK